MRAFAEIYPKYVDIAQSTVDPFGFDIERIARLEPFLAFLFNDWWKVDFTGLEYLPKAGPALIVGNHGSTLPWPALMLLYALMSHKDSPRRLSILADMDWIEDERLHRSLLDIGFVPWSADNAKKLFAAGHIVALFPEGTAGMVKPFSERYRLSQFDWTKFLPAVKAKIPVFPLATLGCDESIPVITNLSRLAQFLELPAFPITPFFPWLPFPLNLASLPVKWRMRLLKSTHHQVEEGRNGVEEAAKRHAKFTEGQVQAELNHLLRQRITTPF